MVLAHVRYAIPRNKGERRNNDSGPARGNQRELMFIQLLHRGHQPLAHHILSCFSHYSLSHTEAIVPRCVLLPFHVTSTLDDYRSSRRTRRSRRHSKWNTEQDSDPRLLMPR